MSALPLGGSTKESNKKKRSASEAAIHEIRRLILSGELAPGRRFVSQNVAEQLGLSHVPVREALRQLEAQGLVSLSPSRSAVVTPLRAEELRSIYRMRLWMEPQLAALSAPQRSAVDLARLDDQLSETFLLPWTEESWNSHNEFHRQLVLPASGTWDLRILDILWAASERFTRLALDPLGAPASETEVEHNRLRHLDLLEAARTRDPNRVRVALETHLEENEALARKRLDTLFSAELGED